MHAKKFIRTLSEIRDFFSKESMDVSKGQWYCLDMFFRDCHSPLFLLVCFFFFKY